MGEATEVVIIELPKPRFSHLNRPLPFFLPFAFPFSRGRHLLDYTRGTKKEEEEEEGTKTLFDYYILSSLPA